MISLGVCCCSLHRSVTVIGRGGNRVDYMICSDSAIQNAIVSRIHARIVRTGSTYCIHDDSRNGIFINNVKIGGLHRCVLAAENWSLKATDTRIKNLAFDMRCDRRILKMCWKDKQGSFRPWKVLKLKRWDFQAWKVLEKGVGPGNPWKSPGILK